jgi:thiol-disulfide isomerase/thioredoxin
LIDMLSVAIQIGTYPNGAVRLDELEEQLKTAGAAEDLLSHVVYQKMWAQYVVGQQQPTPDANLQTKWLADLQAFVAQYPRSSDSAEALLQLGMNQEYAGKTVEATKWYTQLVTDYPDAASAAKARGAVRRLNSIGKPLALRGASLQGGEIDLNSYRGKLVLIQCWATVVDRCKDDMILLKNFYAKNRARGIEIVGINLDDSPAPAKQFLNENSLPWKQMHEAGGLNGRLANELGVMSLPLMILVDGRGIVVSNNIHVAELEAEVNKLLKQPPAVTNAAQRTTKPQR